MITSHYSRKADATGVTLSSLCLVHCLGLPLITVVFPAVGAFSEAEWVHKVLVLAALPVSGLAILQSWGKHHAAVFIVLATTGLVQLVSAAFLEPLHNYEKPLTVIGAIMLASAHIFRWKKHVH